MAGLGLLLLFVGVGTLLTSGWGGSEFTLSILLGGGAWVTCRAPLARVRVDPAGIHYRGIIRSRNIQWRDVGDVRCEKRGGSLMQTSVPVIGVTGGKSIELSILAGYDSAGASENQRVASQVSTLRRALDAFRAQTADRPS
ncbi:PH domain-containing protein [Streptomyces sp. NPDC002073]